MRVKQVVSTGVLCILCFGIQAWAAAPGVYDVRSFGATGGGATLDTLAIQAAIDACHARGGGTVWAAPGRYLTGTLFLKSGVTLHLERGAVLLGSANLQDYPVIATAYRSYTDTYTERSLIYAEDAESIAITGMGTIDGQGAVFEGPYKSRPYMIRLVSCRDVVLEDVRLINGAMWTVHFLACDDVRASGVTIRSRCNRNNDGLDIDGCRNVRISDCDISSGDDAIVLKSTSARASENVVITNCVLSTACNALKMGTESNGGFRNITISNCVIYDTRLSGIALEVVDGGIMDGVAISNITMRGVGCPIFMRLGDRARPYQEGMDRPGIGALRNVILSHIDAAGADGIGCSITGLPGHNVENVSIEDVRLRFAGGNDGVSVNTLVPELPAAYPEYKMYGALPAYAFYCRHVNKVRFTAMEVGFDAPDARPAFVFDDVETAVLDGIRAGGDPRQEALIKFHNVREARIRNCAGPLDGSAFLAVSGAATRDVWLMDNDFRVTRRSVVIGPGVKKREIRLRGNGRR